MSLNCVQAEYNRSLRRFSNLASLLVCRKQTGLSSEPDHQWHKQHQHVSGAEWSGVHRYV